MSHTAQLIPRLLEAGEPAATFIVMAAYLKRGHNWPVREMRDYLAARIVFGVWTLALAYGPRFFAAHRSQWAWIPVCGYWLGYFILMGFLYRVAGAALRDLLRPLPALLRLGQTGYRWIVAAGLLLAIPGAIRVVMSFPSRQFTLALFHFKGSIAAAQLLPVGFVTAIAFRLGFRLRSRMGGLLVGLCLEPAAGTITSWFHLAGTWGWTNLAQETATYAALLLWAIYAFLPDEEPPQVQRSDTLRMWEQIAGRALTQPLIVHRPGTKSPDSANAGKTKRAS